jgi:hypothetical protein
MVHPHGHRDLRIASHFKFSYFAMNTAGVLVLLSLMCGCAGHEASTAPAQKAAPPDQTSKVALRSPPTLAEVNEAVTRIFDNAAVVDATHEPNFFTGDFNGDASEDIAVILKPAPDKLVQLNQDFPPWILRDPFVIPKPGTAPMRIAKSESLFAVIHGYAAKGWRDVQATQTYLLKNAVGLEVKVYAKSDFAGANQGKKTPRLAGDLIAENLGGTPGYLYFTGAQYSWYNPKTFKGEPEIRLTHPGMIAKKKIDLLHPNLVAAEK